MPPPAPSVALLRPIGLPRVSADALLITRSCVCGLRWSSGSLRGMRNSLSLPPDAVLRENMLPLSTTSPDDRVVVVGQPVPNDSSIPLTTLPSQLNVAECQKSTFGWS